VRGGLPLAAAPVPEAITAAGLSGIAARFADATEATDISIGTFSCSSAIFYYYYYYYINETIVLYISTRNKKDLIYSIAGQYVIDFTNNPDFF
jgi:hypothetical protein